MTNLCIKQLNSSENDAGRIYSRYEFDLLAPGQGLTIGNSLRRVLLGDLGGTAITAVKVIGTTHEFSTINGVREDILEILLNLKGIVIKTTESEENFSEAKSGLLKVRGPGVVTADSIKLPPGLEIINPNHYIAAICDSTTLEIELKFEYGFGYKLASHTHNKEDADGFLEIDAIHMPVEKVNFQIATATSSMSTNEKLYFEISTDGSIEPTEALFKGSEILANTFNYIVDLRSQDAEPSFSISETAPVETESITAETHRNISIEELQLSVRAYNCLKRAQINTISDLLKYSPEQLQEIKNFGQKSANEVFISLKNKLGITLS